MGDKLKQTQRLKAGAGGLTTPVTTATLGAMSCHAKRGSGARGSGLSVYGVVRGWPGGGRGPDRPGDGARHGRTGRRH